MVSHRRALASSPSNSSTACSNTEESRSSFSDSSEVSRPDDFRRAKVRGETALEDEAEKNAAVFALPLDVSPARTAERVERSVAVRRAVGSLPPDLRQVVVMKEFEELTFQQISEVLELPLSTVKSRLYTALRQLQMRLQKFGG